MLSVIQRGPSIDRRYRKTVSYQASVSQSSASRVPRHQSAQAVVLLLTVVKAG